MNNRLPCISGGKQDSFLCRAWMLVALLLASCLVQAQTRPIIGTVKDSSGKMMDGVNITIVNKQKAGTATDKNGRFVLEVANGDSLRFSYVGYSDESFTISEGTRNVDIIMTQTVFHAGDEVIVTAFGRKERKEAVVGSVTTIQPGELKIPASNLTNAMAGKIAGVISFQRGGQPGLDNSNFFIRGVTTLGYSASPLILVDNIELSANDLARLQVDDIASFSILKDASAAALYGARGANGVILVTTKDGKMGKAKVDLRVETAYSMPTKSIELADPITYMKLYNEALTTRNPLATPRYDQNKILGTQNTLNGAGGVNPYVYPAVDWMKQLFKDKTTTQRANFSVSGGNTNAKYYIAGSYSNDNGILQVNPVNNFNSGMKFENYQLRANTGLKITNTTDVNVRLWGNFNDYIGPISNQGSSFATDLYSQVLHANPVDFPAYYLPDSANRNTRHILFGNNMTNTGSLQNNPYASLMYGYKSFNESRMSAQFELNQKLSFITPGLVFSGLFSTNRYAYSDVSRNYLPFYYSLQRYDLQTGNYALNWLNNQPGQAQEFLNFNPGSKSVNTYLYMQGRLDYDRRFDNHNVTASLVGTRQQTINPNANDPLTNAPSLLYSLPFRNLGFSGRAGYSYNNKYFFEFNFGYNGSERFAANHRWGFFPTVGAGWVVSNEKFWGEGISKVVTRLKLRGSYGMVGNDNIGNQRFFYLSSVQPNGGPGAVFGTNNSISKNGTAIYAYPNPDVTWEKSKKSNIAAEITFFDKFNIVAEVYQENRYDILIRRGYIPITVGIEGSANNNLQSNLGTASSKGLDLNVNYKQTINKNLWASVLGNLTWTSNKVGHWEEPEYRYSYRFYSGQPIGQPFGYIAERLFVDDKEAANSPIQQFGTTLPMGGDIKYRDINGDGIINQDDQVPIGLPSTPQVIYGFGFSVGYKMFDLSAFFQGSARSSFFMDPSSATDFGNNRFGTAPFVNNAQILQAYANDHWSEENQNLYALWPRLSVIDIPNNQQQSTWWLRDGSFLRLKSVEAGITMPRRWSKKVFMDDVRLYFSGMNLLTFSKFKLWDVEQAGNGFAYPIQKIYNMGLKFNF